jgi:hypothetical protein
MAPAGFSMPADFRCVALRLVLAPRLETLLGIALGIELEGSAIDLAAGQETCIGHHAGFWTIEVGDERAAGVGGNRRDRVDARSEAESVQGECRPPGIEGHDAIPKIERQPWALREFTAVSHRNAPLDVQCLLAG